MKHVYADGVEIEYRRAGEGPPLVLLHGATSDGRLWLPQLDGLSDDFTVVAWDEPGAGASSDLPRQFGLSDYASCLASLIEGLDRGPVHLLGLSWGGTVALELYRRRPELVRTLVLADSYAGWKGSLPEAEVRSRVEGVRQMLAAPRERFDPELPDLLATQPPGEYLGLLEQMRSDVRPASLEAQAFAMAEADQRDLLGQIEAPTLLIWGEEDARSPLSVARQLEAAIPGSRLVVIPDCGHVSNLERPEAFNDAVRAFCLSH